MALVDLNENTYSLGLNGTNQYASITDAAQTGLDITGDITIEAWIKLEQLPSSRFNIASKATEPVTSTNFAYSLSIDNSNKKLQFIFANGSGSLVTNATYTESGFGSGDVGKWIHVAVTADVSSSTIIFYIDGVAKTSSYYQRTATAIANSSDPFHIGAQGDPKDYFDGRIQEVRVWNDIRTAREIRENMYVQLEGTESNLQGYWRLNLGSGDETSNNNDLTLNNSPVFYQDIPFITTKTNIASTYLTRAGTTSGDYWYITDGSQTGLDLTGDLTLELWICLEALPSDVSDAMCLLCKFDDINNYGYYLCLLSNDKLRLYVAQNSSNYLYYETDSAFVTTSDREKWVHVAATFDISARTAVLYKDAATKAATKTEVGTMTAITGSSSSFYIGRFNLSTDYYYGFIDDVKVWSEERTQGEIINGINVICDGTPTNLEACWNQDMQGYDKTSNDNTLIPVNNRTFYTLVPYASDGNTESYQCFTALRLDDNSDNYADNFAHFTENNITYASVDGLRWADFNGTTSYLSLADNDFWDFSNTDWSMSFIFRTDSITGDRVILSQYQDATHYLEIKTSGSAVYLVYYNGSSYSAYTGSVVSTGTVYHVVITQTTAGATKIYFDNNDESLTTSGTYTETNFSGNIEIGRRNAGSYYDGKLSDITLWRKALTSTEITKIWNSGEILRYPFLLAPSTAQVQVIWFGCNM